jgi:hypothetical protein
MIPPLHKAGQISKDSVIFALGLWFRLGIKVLWWSESFILSNGLIIVRCY